VVVTWLYTDMDARNEEAFGVRPRSRNIFLLRRRYRSINWSGVFSDLLKGEKSVLPSCGDYKKG